MRKHFITGVSVVALAVSASAAQAEQASKKEIAGVGAGAAVGAAVGGPPGAIIGAAIGAFAGDRSHQKDVTVESLESDVAMRSAEVSRLNAAMREQQVEAGEVLNHLQTLEQSGVIELHGFLQQGSEMDMPFRTDGVEVAADWEQRLINLAEVVNEAPGLAIQIDGYADPRGSVEYNATLSLQRAEAVRAILAKAGVADEKMSTFGHGESMLTTSNADDPDQFAMQRKVTLTIYRDDAGTELARLTH